MAPKAKAKQNKGKIVAMTASGVLATYEAEAVISVKKNVEKFLKDEPDLVPPDLQLPEPSVLRGNYAYMLLPDNENNDSKDKENKLARRAKRPVNGLVEWLNKNKGAVKKRVLERWPSNYQRGKAKE